MNPISLSTGGLALLSSGETSTTYIQQAIANVQFTEILNEIISVAPTILPVLISILAFKKALRWVIGTVKGA